MAVELLSLTYATLAGFIAGTNTALAARKTSTIKKFIFDVTAQFYGAERQYRAVIMFEDGAAELTNPYEIQGFEMADQPLTVEAAQDWIDNNPTHYVRPFYVYLPEDLVAEDISTVILLTNPSIAEGDSHYDGH